MIQDPNINIIYIAIPHTFHYDYIKKALKAGKHVFCEKAITVNADQFDEVEKLAKDKHLILSEGFTLYHMPIYQKVKKLISDGKLGQIKLVQVNFGSLKDYDPNNRFFKQVELCLILAATLLHLPECFYQNNLKVFLPQ